MVELDICLCTAVSIYSIQKLKKIQSSSLMMGFPPKIWHHKSLCCRSLLTRCWMLQERFELKSSISPRWNIFQLDEEHDAAVLSISLLLLDLERPTEIYIPMLSISCEWHVSGCVFSPKEKICKSLLCSFSFRHDMSIWGNAVWFACVSGVNYWCLWTLCKEEKKRACGILVLSWYLRGFVEGWNQILSLVFPAKVIGFWSPIYY